MPSGSNIKKFPVAAQSKLRTTGSPSETASAGSGFDPVATVAIRRYANFDLLPKVLILVAPSGYGKSVFLSCLARSLSAERSAYQQFFLDHGTNRFDQVLEQLEKAFQCDSRRPAMMFFGGPVIESDFRIDAILQASDLLQDSLTLLFDNLVYQRDADLCDLLERLVLRAGNRLKIVVAAAEAPARFFQRARLEGLVREVGPAELSLSQNEICCLFAKSAVGQVDLADAQLEAIYRKTEGWPAAVRLMQVAISAQATPSSMLTGIDCVDASLSGRLLDHVLTAIEPDVAEFLLEIADLRLFCAELCEYATENADSAKLIRRVLSLNLMIFPSEQAHGWYRFHALFQEFLGHEAKSRVGLQRRLNVLARAAQWCLKHGYWQNALDYAIAARDSSIAMAVLEDKAQELVRDQGQLPLYMESYERVLKIAGECTSDLARYWYIWALMFGRRYEQAHQVLGEMGTVATTGEAWHDRMPHRCEALRIVILFSLDRVEDARTKGRKWLEVDDGLDPFETSSVACAVATAAIADLDFSAARRAISLARTSMTRANSEYGLAWVSCLEALIDVEEGDLVYAGQILDQAMKRARENLGATVSIVSTMELIAAKIALEKGETETARDQVQSGLSQARNHGFIETTKIGMEVAVRLWDGSSHSVFSPHHLEAVETLFPPRLHLALSCEILVRLVRLGQMDAAIEWARRNDLDAILAEDVVCERGHRLASLQRSLNFARLALLIAKRDLTSAASLVESELRSVLKTSCATWKVQLFLASAHVFMMTAQFTQASRAILRAIGIAAPRSLKQPFMEYSDVVGAVIFAEPKKTWALVTESEIAFFLDLKNSLISVFQAPAALVGDDTPGVAVDVPTSREIEILSLLDVGLSNQEIADRLDLTVATVKWHLHNLYSKLKVRSRSAALTKAKRAGLLAR